MSHEYFGSFVTHQLFDAKKMAYISGECVRRASPEHGMTVALEAETQGVFIQAMNTPEGVVHKIYKTCGMREGEDALLAVITNGVVTFP